MPARLGFPNENCKPFFKITFVHLTLGEGEWRDGHTWAAHPKTAHRMGISQADFAGKVGMSAASLCLLESGDSKLPSLANAIKMAEILKKTVGWIVTGKDGLDVATPEQQELLDLAKNMDPDALAALMATAKALSKQH